jgi:hypothetical protein
MKKTIDQLLTEISEDKYQNLSTTSYTFKRDVWNFFTDCKDKICVEFGTHKGQTTRILSFLFKKVYTINNNENESAKRLNSDIDNIVYINFDLYNSRVLPIDETIDVFFVDAGHEYDNVIMDINRIFSMNCADECYIVFDDYGCNVHSDDVKKAVDLAIERDYISIVKRIGHDSGHSFGTGPNNDSVERVLLDSEGLITKINWK